MRAALGLVLALTATLTTPTATAQFGPYRPIGMPCERMDAQACATLAGGYAVPLAAVLIGAGVEGVTEARAAVYGMAGLGLTIGPAAGLAFVGRGREAIPGLLIRTAVVGAALWFVLPALDGNSGLGGGLALIAGVATLAGLPVAWSWAHDDRVFREALRTATVLRETARRPTAALVPARGGGALLIAVRL